MHLMALHVHGSSNPVGITGNMDRIPMHSYFIFKDLITVFIFILFFSLFVFFSPNSLGHIRPLIYLCIFMKCAICWKYLYIYNKTTGINLNNISDLFIYNLNNLLKIFNNYIYILYLIPSLNKSYNLYPLGGELTIYAATRLYSFFSNPPLQGGDNGPSTRGGNQMKIGLKINKKINPVLVKYYYKKYNQQITNVIYLYIYIYLYLLVGISETTRTQKMNIYKHIKCNSKISPLELKSLKNKYIINPNLVGGPFNIQHIRYLSKISYNKLPQEVIKDPSTVGDNNLKFNQWLAGLIDGDGCFGITEGKYTNCEITVALEDEKALRQIQNKFGGSVKLRSGVKAIRYRLRNKKGMINLVNAVNGNIRHSKRLLQLSKVCSILNIDVISPIPLTIDNAWFTGFFDADGTINYYWYNKNNKSSIRPQLFISVTNKYLQDIQPYKDIFGGNIYYDKSQNGYFKWVLTNEYYHMIFYNYIKINPSKTVKLNRLFLIKEFYYYYNLKAFREDNKSLIYKSWIIFDKKWNNK